MSLAESHLAPQKVRVLRLLEFLLDHPVDGPSDLDGFGDRDAAPLVSEAEQLGYVETFRSVMRLSDAFPPVMLTASGRAWAEDMRANYRDRRRRSMACRNAIVRTLYNADSQVAGSDSFFSEDGPNFFGKPFPHAEVEGAFNYLLDNGLIQGTKTWGPTIARPRLLSPGIDCAENFDSDVYAYLQHLRGAPDSGSPGSYNFINYGNVGQAAIGNHSAQILNQGPTTDEVLALLEAIRAAILDVPQEDEREHLKGMLDDVHEAVTAPNPDSAVITRRAISLQRLAQTSFESAATAAGTEGGQRLMAAIGHLIAALG